MKNLNIKIWTLSAILLFAFTCAYTQQGNLTGDKIKEKKEAVTTKKEKKLDAVKEQRENAKKEEQKAKDQSNKPKEKKETPNAKEIQKLPKANKDTSDVKEKPMKEEGAKPAKDTVHNEGHAYGKDKGGLEGKEFGQARAEQARLNKVAKKQELTNSVVAGETKVAEAKQKIQTAKEQLEKDKKSKKVSETEYQAKKEKIEKAEKAVGELESKVQEGKQMTAE